MTMQPFTPATEAVLRLLWRRGATGRLVDLGAIDLRQLRRAGDLGLVEVKQAQGRNKARLTASGRYFARMVALVPARPGRREALLQMRSQQARTPIERFIAQTAHAD